MGQHRWVTVQGQIQDPRPRGRCVPRPHDPTKSISRLRLQLNKPPRTGSGGLSVAQQLYNRFELAGKPLKAGDIAIADAAEYHNYQVGV